jgi:uncharacterized protein YciI
MTPASIEEAYGPFAAMLREGSFDAPAEGWPAELVAAHISANNDLIAEVAELVAAGSVPSYDNAAGVDEEQLGALVTRAGGLAGLAGAIEESAARLARAYGSLSAEQLATEVPAVIKDGGATVVDAPVAIGQLIEGNASFHLDLHQSQLAALRSPRTAEPPAEFDVYELVLLVRPDDPPELDEAAADRLQAQHLGHFAAMREAGNLKVAGPLTGEADRRLRGVCLYQVGSTERARELAEQDPAVRAGIFTVEVMPWYTAKGALEFNL